MRDWQHDADHVHRRRWLTLIVLCLSLVVIVVDNSILNVAVPTLAKPESQGGLGAGQSDLQWIIDSYVLVFAGLLLTAGALGDRFGRYRALAGGLAVFGVGSTLAAFSSSPGALIGFRALMGVGGAFIMPATLSIITNVFRDPRERGRAIGAWAGISALGLALGPVTGGFLLEHFWWGSVLLVNVPVVIVGLVGGFLLIPDSRDPSAPRVDVPGAVLSMVGLFVLLWGLIEGPGKGWGSPEVLGAFAVGLALLGAFLVWERVTATPMLDLGFFSRPRFSAASMAITLTFMALMGMIFVLTQYLQSVRDFRPVTAGAVLMPMALVMVVLAPMSARLVERFGSKLVLGSGLVTVSAGVASMSLFTPGTPTWLIILSTMVFASGMANTMAPATESIMGSLPREKAGVGSAVNDTTRQVGGAIGVALIGSLLASRYGGRVEADLGGAGLPADVLDDVSGNIQDAVGTGRGIGGELGARIIDVSQQAFMSGMRLSVLVAAGITLVAAVGVFRWLPARAPEPEAAGPAGPAGGDRPDPAVIPAVPVAAAHQ
jgi:EmrB/QacA subfamily drug resistance transporter